MLNEILSTSLGLVSASAALFSIPGSVALARWSWAARRKPIPVSSEISNSPILILIPAHNEALSLPQTLPPIVAQAERDGLCAVCVIADNCTDQTAEIARALGAMILCRHNPQLRGKGHALAYAFERFAHFPWFLIIDADSSIDEHFLTQLRAKIAQQPDAIQTRYEPKYLPEDPLADLKQWALHAFNVVRQRGRANLGESVSLLGNGFAISAQSLLKAPYRAASIVEDFEYQLSLQAQGLKISWLEEACVQGEMPQGKGEQTQRVRWEGGRIAMLRQYCAPILLQLLQGKAGAWSALQELMLLPLNLHVLLLLIACLGEGPISIIGQIGLLLVLAHIALALIELPAQRRLHAVFGLPRYLAWKLLQLPAILRSSAKNTQWQRSERKVEGGISHES